MPSKEQEILESLFNSTMNEKNVSSLIADCEDKSCNDYQSIGMILTLFTSNNQVHLANFFIDKIIIPQDSKVCLEILQGIINFRDPNTEDALPILQKLIDCGLRVDGINDSGKDAIQTAAQQKTEVDEKIVKILVQTKKAPKLEDEIADFVLFLLEENKNKESSIDFSFSELEKKEFFADKNRMTKFFEAYQEKNQLSQKKLNNLCQKIKENYNVDYSIIKQDFEDIDTARIKYNTEKTNNSNKKTARIFQNTKQIFPEEIKEEEKEKEPKKPTSSTNSFQYNKAKKDNCCIIT